MSPLTLSFTFQFILQRDFQETTNIKLYVIIVCYCMLSHLCEGCGLLDGDWLKSYSIMLGLTVVKHHCASTSKLHNIT